MIPIPHDVLLRAHLLHLDFVIDALCVERDGLEMEGDDEAAAKVQERINALLREQGVIRIEMANR